MQSYLREETNEVKMILLRKANERGVIKLYWLESKLSFSFADYYDEKFMNFGSLRVLNEDRIKGDSGFHEHGHRDMEIITYIIKGGLVHLDSMGNRIEVKAGDIQRMSAGSGVRHAGHNIFKDQETHLLQIWILPEKIGINPSYEQKSFSNFICNDIIHVISKKGENGTISINQDIDMYVAKTQGVGEKNLKTFKHRHIWIQVVKGNVETEGHKLLSGDGIGLTEFEKINIKWSANSEFILLDMP